MGLPLALVWWGMQWLDCRWVTTWTPLLKHLQWLPKCYWARFKVLVLIYKALNNMGLGCPKQLSEPSYPIPINEMLLVPHVTGA